MSLGYGTSLFSLTWRVLTGPNCVIFFLYKSTLIKKMRRRVDQFLQCGFCKNAPWVHLTVDTVTHSLSFFLSSPFSGPAPPDSTACLPRLAAPAFGAAPSSPALAPPCLALLRPSSPSSFPPSVAGSKRARPTRSRSTPQAKTRRREGRRSSDHGDVADWLAGAHVHLCARHH
jgi:hypothetical protein